MAGINYKLPPQPPQPPQPPTANGKLIKTISMTTKEFKRTFHDLVIDMIMESNPEKDFMKFQSILGVVDTLFQDGREDDLSMVLRLHFPDYFTDYKPFEVNG